PAFFKSGLPFFHFYRRNAVVQFLEQQIGVAIGRDFRGSAITLPSDYHKDLKPYAAWRREATFTYSRAYLANDLGAHGLHHFNIPTLDEETHNVTPQIYLTVRELLTWPGIDVYDKHFALPTRLNEPIMSLLGLRYIVADYEIPNAAERLSMPLPDEAKA